VSFAGSARGFRDVVQRLCPRVRKGLGWQGADRWSYHVRRRHNPVFLGVRALRVAAGATARALPRAVRSGAGRTGEKFMALGYAARGVWAVAVDKVPYG